MALVEPLLKAEKELEQYRISGVNINPDRYYELVLTLTLDEKKARNAQAELMLNQMVNRT